MDNTEKLATQGTKVRIYSDMVNTNQCSHIFNDFKLFYPMIPHNNSDTLTTVFWIRDVTTQ